MQLRFWSQTSGCELVGGEEKKTKPKHLFIELNKLVKEMNRP